MFRKTRIENGLRILTAPIGGTKTVTILVMCATGSDYEAPREEGISHFLEHLFFKGTASRPTHEHISHELDAMGSISNAFTDHETTGYFIKVGTIYASQALELLADIYFNSLLAPDEVEREKQVIIEEMHRNRDTPSSYVWRLWEELLYKGEPAGRDISGSEESVRRLSRGDLSEYFAHQYVAKNTAVVIAGDIDEQKTIRDVTQLFSNIRDAEPRRKPGVSEAQEQPDFLFSERKTDQSHLIVGFRGYDALHPRRYAADVLATILGGSLSSRMFSRIREKMGISYAVFSASENYSNRGYLVTYAGVTNESVSAGATGMLDEYKKIREEGVTEYELARTKDFLKGRMLMAFETSNSVASFVAGEEMLTGKPLTVEDVFATLDAVTTADVRAVAEELIRPERLNAVLLGPTAGGVEGIIKGFS